MKYFKKTTFLMTQIDKVKTPSMLNPKYFGYTLSLSYAGFIHYNLFKLFKNHK